MSKVIDADGHIVEPSAIWEEYTERAYRERMLQARIDQDGVVSAWVDGEPVIRSFTPPTNNVAIVIPGGLAQAERSRSLTMDDILPGSYDPHARVQELDREGIQTVFLYPSLWLGYGDIKDPQLAAAACRAYSNWLADFCKPHPDRLQGVAPIPLQDVDEAVKEIHRVVKELNFHAVFIRTTPFNGRLLNDPIYDPFWREAQELNVPVALHATGGTRRPTLGQERYQNRFYVNLICHAFEQQTACMDLICGGVLEKFPKLRIAFLESGAGWISYWLNRMDGHYEKMGPYVPWLKKKPSEYFFEQCYVSFDSDERALKALVEFGAGKNLLWSSDYPHFDCTFPGAIKAAKEACQELSESMKDSVLRGNAVQCYHLA